MTDWTRLQVESVNRILARMDAGQRSIVATGPTGIGKTAICKRLIRECENRQLPWLFLTHRKMLLKQTHESLMSDLISHGIRASGWEDFWMPHAGGQLAMIQSERASQESGKWERYPAKVVFVDEAHANKSGFAEQLLRDYLADGATVIGVTATPVGMGGLFKHMEIIADKTTARSIGALLPAHTYAPDEVNVSDVKTVSVDGEFSQPELAKRFKRHQVVGRVYEHWMKLNPEQLPAIGFAPGVKESMWFCDEFIRRGVKCAHIDGEKVYLGEHDEDGEPIVYKNKEAEELREQVAEQSKSGEIKVVWNRFVMREGVDWPWLYHAIFATAFSTVEAWDQSTGRVLRNYAGYEKVIIQDHGGNVWRPGLGSPNADREWSLECTNSSMRKAATQKMQTGEDKQPKGCPNCNAVNSFSTWMKGDMSCNVCGYKFKMSVRNVYQTDGTLQAVRGDAVKKKHSKPDAQKMWDQYYWRARKSRSPHASNFNQIRARFEKETGYRVCAANGQTVAMKDGEQVVLNNAPPPKSSAWVRRVKSVEINDLQRA